MSKTNQLHTLARRLSLLSAGMSALTLLRPRNGMLSGMLWAPKLTAEAQSPFLALAGGLGALLGLARRDRTSFCLGLLGAAVAARHLRRVSAPHDTFEGAFGPGWSARIPPTLGQRMLQRRYDPLLPRPAPVPWERDVVYGTQPETGTPLRADVWQPPAGVPRTGLAVLYLFGGGWHYMDKDMGNRRLFRHLAGQGHVVMDVGYTLAPRVKLEGMIADVRRAIAWMKEKAGHYGVDPERIVLMGYSSGAHLALLAAYSDSHPALRPPGLDADTSVRGVVSYYGLPDLRASYTYFREHFSLLTGRTLPGRCLIAALEALFRRIHMLPPKGHYVDMASWISSFVGGPLEEMPERYRLGSPIEHVGPHCPPSLLIQGDHDFTGVLLDARRLHQALRRASAPSVYVEIPNTDHAFDICLFNFPQWSPAMQAAIYDTERFLALLV